MSDEQRVNLDSFREAFDWSDTDPRPAVARPDQGTDDGERVPVAGCCIDVDGQLWHEPGDGQLCQARHPAPAAHPLAGVLQDVAAPIVERDALREAIADLATELTRGRWDAQVAAAYAHADALLDGPLAAVLAQAAADRAAVERVRRISAECAANVSFKGFGLMLDEALDKP